MGYDLELPRDVETDINEFLDRRFQGNSYAVARSAITAELKKLEINPRLGAPHYGGPSERRLFYQFRIVVDGTTYELQLAYRVNEATKMVTAHGFDEYPPTR
jgi:hypothetical protein